MPENPPLRQAMMIRSKENGNSTDVVNNSNDAPVMSMGTEGTFTNKIIKQAEEETAKTWSVLGNLARVMDNETDMQECYQRALNQNPSCVEALFGLACMYKSQKKYQTAIETFQRVVDINPEDGDAWAEMAFCFLMINELQHSYTSYQRALYHLKNPKNAYLWYGIGLLYNKYNSYNHALEAFDACLKMDPYFEYEHEVNFRAAIIAKKQGRLNEALDVLGKVLSAVDDPSWKCDVWCQIGHVYELKRDVEGAKNSYHKSLENNKNHVKALQQLGWLHYKDKNDYNTAIEYLTRATEINPNDGLGWYLLGRCYMAAQSHESAYSAYEQAVNADPNNPNVWCSLGVLYYQLRQNRDALDAYTRAIKLDPNLCEVWYNVGTLYDSCGQDADALDAYKKAQELGASGEFMKNRINEIMLSLTRNGTNPENNPRIESQEEPLQSTPQSVARTNNHVARITPQNSRTASTEQL